MYFGTTETKPNCYLILTLTQILTLTLLTLLTLLILLTLLTLLTLLNPTIWRRTMSVGTGKLDLVQNCRKAQFIDSNCMYLCCY